MINKLLFFLFMVKSLRCFTMNSIHHGCSAYDCRRVCLNSEISETPGDNGFRFEINAAKDKYMPGKTYTASRISIIMRLIEYRIFMPLTVEENLIGQLWSFAEISRLNTSGGEGVEILQNRLFELPIDHDGRILYKALPEYEDYDTALKSKSKSVRKSASKENFRASRFNPERSKSVDAEEESDDYQSIHSSDFTLKENGNLKYGQFTHKIYYMASKLPWFVRKLLPKDSTLLLEKSWNMYPTVKTLLLNDYFKSSFRIELDTITRACANGVADENVHNLTAEQLEKREIVVIDISEAVGAGEYKPDEDPALFKSQKTGRGPLKPGWIKKEQPMICCYKLVCAEFKVFGLQTKVEAYFKNMYKQLFTTFHRQVFCWLDKWFSLTIEDVRRIEKELAEMLVQKIQEGDISACKLADLE